jgi:hypothetical protein
VAKFRKKPVVIEAFEWTGRNVVELTTWASAADLASKTARGLIGPTSNREIQLPLDLVSLGGGMFRLEIATPEGVHAATVGDWIICGVVGEFYPCKPDIFAATYEAA